MEDKNTNNGFPPGDPIGLDVYKKVFGENESDTDTLIGLREFTINHLFAKIWSRSCEKYTTIEKQNMIAMKERSMITVALLAAQGRNDELKKHIGAARHLGITKEQLLEIMIHVAHYAGWPAGHSGQNTLKIYEEEHSLL